MVIVGIRPEHLEDPSIARDGSGSQPKLRGKVVLREALGSEIMVHFIVDARPALTDDVRELAADVGDDRTVTAAPEELGHTTIVGRFNPRSSVKVGEKIEVPVDTRSLHFFDPETGLGIYSNDEGKETK